MRRAVEERALDPGGDSDLVIRARAGDRDCYETLFRRHRERVARTAFLLVRDRHLAQDVTQEAFLIGWRDLRRLRDPAHFRAWVAGIAVNLARRRGGGIRLFPGRPIVPLEGGPERASEAGSDADLDISVRQAVAALPVRLR